MALKKKDFVEIKFTGRLKDTNEIFDSNIKEDLKKSNLNLKAEPFIFCLGEGMFLKGIDKFLVGKDLGKHKIELTPENAFGKRDSTLIQTIPLKIFREQKLNPIPGAMFNFDGRIAKVLTASGGRVMVDFNNPIAGKDVIYEVEVVKKLDDLNEKLNSFNKFLFKRELKFEVKDKKIVLEIEKPLFQFAEMFKDKYKEIFDLDLELKELQMKEMPQPKEMKKKVEEKVEDMKERVEKKE